GHGVDHRDGAEDLLVVGLHLRRDTGEHRGLHERALAIERLTSYVQGRALLHGALDLLDDASRAPTEDSGPTSTSSSWGSPSRALRQTSTTVATKASLRSRRTNMRLGEWQAWPAFDSRAVAAIGPPRSMSASSGTSSGSEPPSSCTDFVTFAPAFSATAAPALSLPVSETPRARGSAIISASWSWEAKTLREASVGTPAWWRIRAMVSEEAAQIPACLRMIVLPAIRFGATKRATW